jgi:hypothetical protein
MIKLQVKNILLFLLITLVVKRGNGQTALDDTSFLEIARNNTIAVYQQAIASQSTIVNGRQFKPYAFTFIKGHPYFETNKFSTGTIHYEGNYYDSVQLMYDENSGLLILDAGIRLELINERIPEFSISGHRFKRIVTDSFDNALKTGFYEVLYEGKNIELLKKEFKEFKEALSVTEGFQVEILEKRSYYIRKDGQYFRVKNKNAALDILRQKRGELEKFIKSKKLNFRKDMENAITQTAIYYDQLLSTR